MPTLHPLLDATSRTTSPTQRPTESPPTSPSSPPLPPAALPPTTTPAPTPQPHTLGYAHIPLQPPNNDTIRVLSHNINTLQTTTDAELISTFQLYSELDPTIIGIQECNKNWNIPDKTLFPLCKIVNRNWPGAKIVTTNTNDDIFSGPHQPGGVAQLVLHKLTGRVLARGSDDLGRYAWQELLLSGNQHLIIITAYRVSQSSMTCCGLTTAAMQQWRQLRNTGIDSPNPRQQILTDLTSFILPHVLAGHEVLLLMDANSRLDSAAMSNFLDGAHLHDLMAEYLPTTPPHLHTDVARTRSTTSSGLSASSTPSPTPASFLLQLAPPPTTRSSTLTSPWPSSAAPPPKYYMTPPTRHPETYGRLM